MVRANPSPQGKTPRERTGPAARGVVRQIDQQLERIETRLAGYEGLLSERKRLIAARAALTGTAPARSERRITQEDLSRYLAEHPGSLPAQIAADLGVPVTNVSQHLYRGKATRFVRKRDGWHLRHPERE